MNARRSILAAMFCVGAFSLAAQVLFTREMLVVVFGNELSIATLFSAWLIAIGVGAFFARRGVARVAGAGERDRVRRALLVLVVVMAGCLPVQVAIIRALRLILHVPLGEHMPFAQIALSALLVFAPTCLSIGLFFPFACHAWFEAGARDEDGAAAAVSRIYAVEALGSMLSGAMLTFVLLPLLSPIRIVTVSVGVALIAACPLARTRRACVPVCAAALCVLLSAVAYPGWLQSLERWTVETRWRAFGALPSDGSDAEGSVRLVRSVDSRYQNLAVTEAEGQYALYANGDVLFVFPDPIGYEHAVHFIMAQNPTARSVLLLGGNPVGDLPELLKYPLDTLVYVELDPAIGRIVADTVPDAYRTAMSDPRVEYVVQDAVRYVQRCRRSFDVILVNAPDPTTASANRYYTVEFFTYLRRILTPDGFVHLSVLSSERLQSEAADVGASVYKSLMAVFPRVQVTAEARNEFFAGGLESPVTFDRETLVERSRRVSIDTQYFRPEYFFGADELAKEKTAFVRKRFEETDVPLNTNVRPAAYFYGLVLWSRFSAGSGPGVLSGLKSLRAPTVAGVVAALGVMALAVGLLARLARQRARRGARDKGLGPGRGGAWARLMASVLIATAGLCGMALEIVLIFTFQNLFGTVYTRMGLIVAAFMAGLVIGAPSGRLMARGSRVRARLGMASIVTCLMLFALYLPAGIGWASSVQAGRTMWGVELLIYGAVMAVGWAVGAEFPLANRLFCDAGGTVGTAAAVTDAADHLGAAAGSLAVGCLLVPVTGIGGACSVLACVQAVGLLCLASLVLTTPADPTHPE